MRTIKFRGKRLDNGEWVYGDLIENQGRFFIYHATSETTLMDDNDRDITVIAIAVDNDTIGQFTGLHDKNGKEIYEGDIICSEKYKYIHVVSYDDTIGSFVGKTPRDRYGTFTRPMSQKWINEFDKEIIGNIHDNPELLKGGEE